jgi:hypothetical protein
MQDIDNVENTMPEACFGKRKRYCQALRHGTLSSLYILIHDTFIYALLLNRIRY